MKKTKINFETIILIVVILTHLFVALSPESKLLNWYQTDDAFYYFKVAQNITEGKGITFDGFNPTNGFHPLWMLICIPVFALARFNLILPLRVLVMVLALLNAATGILLYRLGKRFLSTEVGWVMAFFWMFYPAIHGLTTMLGMETGVNAFSIVLMIYLISIWTPGREAGKSSWKKYLWLGLATCLVLLSRLDNIFLVLIMGVWLVFRDSSLRWQILLDFMLILTIGVVSYFLRIPTENIFGYLTFAYIYIGLSLAIKPLVLYFSGGYDLKKRKIFLQLLIYLVVLSLASVIIFAVIYVLNNVLKLINGFPRSVLVLDWGLSLAILTGIHLLIQFIAQRKKTSTEDLSLKANLKIWLQRAVAFFGPLGLILGSYMSVNLAYAGTALPVSGQIKRWWGTLPNTVYGTPIKTLSNLFASWFTPTAKDGPWSLITNPLDNLAGGIANLIRPGDPNLQLAIKPILLTVIWGVIFAVIVLIIYKQWAKIKIITDRIAILPFFTGCFFSIISYKATGYLHAKFWYWIGEMVLLVLVGGIFLEVLFQWFYDTKKSQIINRIISVAICVLLILPFCVNLWFSFSWDAPLGAVHSYVADTEFVEQITGPGSIIGMTGGGATAYFIKNRTIVNLDGLINSKEYFDEIQQGDADRYFKSIHLNYVLGSPSMILESDPYRWIFTGRLEPQKIFGDTTLYLYLPLK